MSDKITPEQLRNSADYTEALVVQCGHELVSVKALEHMDQLRAHASAPEELAALREQLAERSAELAALKGHAEAIARCRIKANGYTDWSKEALDEAFAAYRAAFPKE